MKLSQICQWALAGLGAQYRALQYQKENALFATKYQRAEMFEQLQREARAEEKEIIDLIVKIEKGEIIDETF